MQFIDVVKGISSETKLTQTDIMEIFKLYTNFVVGNIKNEGEIPLCGLGKFKFKEFKEKNGRNPQTGEDLVIPACKKIVFDISPTLQKTTKEVL